MVQNTRALPQTTKLNEYQIQTTLGQGCFGVTYLGVDTSTRQKVIIKEYLPRDCSIRGDDLLVEAAGNAKEKSNFDLGLKRFVEEGHRLLKLRHPNIIHNRQIIEANGTAYLVSDYCDGTPLDELVLRKGGALARDMLDLLFASLLDALEVLHDAALVHGDIKPSNIFLLPDGVPILLGFEPGRIALAEQSNSMTSFATTHYSALERYSGYHRQGDWTDIYSLAATVYYAATGERPQTASERAVQDVLEPLLIKASGRYDSHLVDMIDRGLALEPPVRARSIREWRMAPKHVPPQSNDAKASEHDASPKRAPEAASPNPPHREAQKSTATRNSLAAFAAVAILIVGLIIAIMPKMGPSVQETDGNSVDADVTEMVDQGSGSSKFQEPRARAAAAAARQLAEAARQVSDEANMSMDAQTAYSDLCPDYEGAFRDSCFGASTHHGNFIQGNWDNDQLNGPGIYQWQKSGRGGQLRFEGTYKNHNFSGPGVLYFSNGDRYEGNFENDKENGQGIRYYADGTRYEGNFRDGVRIGPGVFYQPDGSEVYW